ncbi:MAG TPA: pentapeptide repeat-containing protein, partial [Anaerolineae bacterium]|nr:pentapeptide repeat-containing protein [Anaerolineae bacterium]
MPKTTKPAFSSIMRTQMVDAYNLDELRQVTHALEINWDDLAGDTISRKIMSFLGFLARRSRLGELLDILREERKTYEWPDRPPTKSAVLSEIEEIAPTPEAINITIAEERHFLKIHEWADENKRQWDADKKNRPPKIDKRVGKKLLRELKLSGRDFSDLLLFNSDLIKSDLSYALLQKINLSGSKLNDANLREAILTNAVLVNVDLSRADLRDANLTGVNLSKAILDGADLRGANLANANLSGASLIGAKLEECVLRNVSFKGAKLKELDFTLCHTIEGNMDFSNADLSEAQLHGLNLKQFKFNNADLSNANLSNSNLESSELDGATLKDTNTSDAICKEASFKGVDFTNTKITETDLRF